MFCFFSPFTLDCVSSDGSEGGRRSGLRDLLEEAHREAEEGEEGEDSPAGREVRHRAVKRCEKLVVSFSI